MVSCSRLPVDLFRCPCLIASSGASSSLTDSNVLSPEGSASVQHRGGTHYIAIPARLANFYGIEQGTDLIRAFDPASTCLIVPLRDDVDLFGDSSETV